MGAAKTKVAKFGGSSLANSESVGKAINIVLNDPLITHVVVSAPGKRHKQDTKITDHLQNLANPVLRSPSMDEIRTRFTEIAEGLKLSGSFRKSLRDKLDAIERAAARLDPDSDLSWIMSRGECLMACIFAKALNWRFVDAANIIKCDSQGNYNREATARAITPRRVPRHSVIPGFYGGMPDGKSIKLFPRGGSDTSGSIIAFHVKAGIYLNYTDVNGICTADPDEIYSVSTVPCMSRTELRGLAHRGAQVLHADSLLPLEGTKVEVQVRNTFQPHGSFTRILADGETLERARNYLVGIAGHNACTFIKIAKAGMTDIRGFARELSDLFVRYEINVLHWGDDVDELCALIKDEELRDKDLKLLEDEIRATFSPDELQVQGGAAVVSAVYDQRYPRTQMAGLILTALANAKIEPYFSSGIKLSLNLCIERKHYLSVSRLIHERFVLMSAH